MTTTFIPTAKNNTIPFTIPAEWYGREVVCTFVPVKYISRKKSDITKYFGAWKTDKSAEEIIADIRNSRTSGKTRKEDFIL